MMRKLHSQKIVIGMTGKAELRSDPGIDKSFLPLSE